MKTLEELKVSAGPWKAVRDEMNDEESPYRVDVASPYSLDGQFSESDANLIAAAPELYKTEYELVGVVERLMNWWNGTCDPPPRNEFVAALEAAKKALAKAAGDDNGKGDDK